MSSRVEAGATATVRGEAGELQRFAAEVLAAVGVRSDDAWEMADQIMGSELAGHESHGLRRLAEYVARVDEGFADPAAVPVIDLDHGSLARIDGRRGFGHLVMREATDLAIARARAHGIAGIGVHGGEYAGRFADFCERAAEAGVATVLFANDSGAGQVVAPPGGLQGRLSTNPIAAGIPRASAPHLVLDMATSAVAIGRLSEWRDRGEPIPREWADEHGVMQFAGGAKGFGLALIAEALAGALTTAGTVSERPAPDQQGVFMIAVDVAGMRPLGDFTAEVERFAAYIKDTPVAPGSPSVRLPGESSARTAHQRTAHGVPVQSFTWAALGRLADRFGLAAPTALR